MDRIRIVFIVAIVSMFVCGADGGVPGYERKKFKFGPGTLLHSLRKTVEKLHKHLNRQLTDSSTAANAQTSKVKNTEGNYGKFGEIEKPVIEQLSDALCKLCRTTGDIQCMVIWCNNLSTQSPTSEPDTRRHPKKPRPFLVAPAGKSFGPAV